MFPKKLDAWDLGAGYYASPIQQVRAVIHAYETGRVYGLKRVAGTFTVAVDLRVLLALLRQAADQTAKRESC
ncbi:MAG: hypothetical protein P4N41_25885 [Negativicutes bacterium]|nr:hypothetical protein [Negativicutes bacterium]